MNSCLQSFHSATPAVYGGNRTDIAGCSLFGPLYFSFGCYIRGSVDQSHTRYIQCIYRAYIDQTTRRLQLFLFLLCKPDCPWLTFRRRKQITVVLRLNKSKGKAVPLQAWSCSQGSRKLRFPDFMTTAQDGGKVFRLTHRPPIPPGNATGTHFCQRAIVRSEGFYVNEKFQ